MRRGRWLALVTAVAVAMLVLFVVQWHRRAEEWAHGGDAVTMLAQPRVADAQLLPATATALGYRDTAVLPTGFAQAIVVRLDWRGPAPRDSWYHLIALDRRVQPPQPLQVYGGWNTQGATGSGWAGTYETLARHYDWLAATASVRTEAGWTSTTTAVGAPATGTGSMTGIFRVDGHALPFTDANQVLVAVFCVDGHDQVRWARRVAA
jgi:hypothetical protein